MVLPPPARPPGKPAAKAGQPQMQSTPDGQTCQKCGAVFHWERLDKTNPKSPLRLKLDTGSKRCDCGYGKGRA